MIKNSNFKRINLVQNFLGVKVLLLIGLIAIGFNVLYHRNQTEKLSLSQNNLKKFNLSLEKIEGYIESKDWVKACKKSQEAEQLIKKYGFGFKEIEPNYDWKEISKVLQIVSRQFCRS